MLSPDSGARATAYHVWMNCPPPIATWTVLGKNESPAVSLTVKAAPFGQQSQPTTITSEDCVVVNDTEQEVTYPHPFWLLPSSAVEEVVAEACPAKKAKIDVVTNNAAIGIGRRLRTNNAQWASLFNVRKLNPFIRRQNPVIRSRIKFLGAESRNKNQNPI